MTPGADFPASALSPFFQLVSLTATTAQVAIAGGSYASGQATLTLQVNKPVTLVNTADGTRYTLLLLPQGTTAPVGGGRRLEQQLVLVHSRDDDHDPHHDDPLARQACSGHPSRGPATGPSS